MSRRPRYRYQVVTHCGAGLYSSALTYPKARAALADKIREDPERDWELERVEQVDESSRRYWLRRGGAWRLYPDRAFTPSSADFEFWRREVGV